MTYLQEEKETDPKGTLTGLPDEEVLALSVKKPSVFEIIVDRYQAAFLRKLAPMFRNFEDDANDVVQEAFVKIYLNAGRYRVQPGASFKSWAYKILLNTAFTFLKKKNREHALTADLDPEIYETLPDLTDERGKREIIDEALSVLSRMPNTLADVLRPTIFEGKDQPDVAKGLGLSLGAVRTRVHRAKKEFRKIANELR